MKNIKTYYPYLAGVGMASIFGFSFMFTSMGLDVASPLELISYRFLLAASLITLLWLFGIIKINYKGKNIGPLLLLSLAEPVIYFIFETYGVKYTSSSLSGLMIALIPVAVTVLAVVFLKERPSLYQLLFILLSVTGVVFIIFMTGIESRNTSIMGFLFLLGAVLSAAFYSILARKSSLEFSPIEITFVMMWLGAIAFNILNLTEKIIKGYSITQYFHNLTNYKVLIPVLYLGILSSIVAYFLNNYALSKLPASQASVFANLTTVISVIAGITIRREAFYWYHIIGAIMILIGVWGTNYFGKVSEMVMSSEEIH
ncbi:MAG TPA: DMT family transporter [Clostridia bacterium]|nr:DMT family transporter [Clostridia bacterium]